MYGRARGVEVMPMYEGSGSSHEFSNEPLKSPVDEKEQEKLSIVCKCCFIALSPNYHVMGGKPYCNKCYVASHHLNLPQNCPHTMVSIKIMKLLETCELNEYEAERIIARVFSRMKK